MDHLKYFIWFIIIALLFRNMAYLCFSSQETQSITICGENVN